MTTKSHIDHLLHLMIRAAKAGNVRNALDAIPPIIHELVGMIDGRAAKTEAQKTGPDTDKLEEMLADFKATFEARLEALETAVTPAKPAPTEDAPQTEPPADDPPFEGQEPTSEADTASKHKKLTGKAAKS